MTYKEFAQLRRLAGLTQAQAACELGVSDRDRRNLLTSYTC